MDKPVLSLAALTYRQRKNYFRKKDPCYWIHISAHISCCTGSRSEWGSIFSLAKTELFFPVTIQRLYIS